MVITWTGGLLGLTWAVIPTLTSPLGPSPCQRVWDPETYFHSEHSER
jgi:hypothetical protein